MKSIAFREFGSPSNLEVIDRPVPTPKPGEVVVRVSAATVNPTDLLMLQGKQAALMESLDPPFIAGMECSGHVHAAGDQSDLQLGQPVIGVVNPRRPAGGAQTEYLCLPASQVAALPEAADLIAAATIPMNALTAMLSLELVDLKPGQVLLVTGGAGMLGGSVLQLARDAGLIAVTNVAKQDAELVQSLGASTVLPRAEGLIEAYRRTFSRDADGLIDGALIGNHVSSLIRPGGVAVALRKSNPISDPRLNCTYVSVLDAMARPEFLRATVDHIRRGILRGRVAPGGVFSLTEARAAYEMAETSKARGRVILRFDA